jgi:Protein of unknown function (DUF1003)
MRPPKPVNPALLKHAAQREEFAQNRIADAITAFAGSTAFVYLHIVWFACWIGLGVEHYPFGLLTMIVSLEAIFLSTFVMISQNRADTKRQVLADQRWWNSPEFCGVLSTCDESVAGRMDWNAKVETAVPESVPA